LVNDLVVKESLSIAEGTTLNMLCWHHKALFTHRTKMGDNTKCWKQNLGDTSRLHYNYVVSYH